MPCKGKVKVLGNDLEVLRDHTHGSEQHKVSALKALQAMKTRAQTTDEAPQQILTANLGGLSEGAAAYLPDIPVVRRNIHRQRQKAGNPLPIPQSREDIPVPLPDRYTTTSAGRNFLLYESQDANRILVFGTDASLQLLEKNEHWLMERSWGGGGCPRGEMSWGGGNVPGGNVLGGNVLGGNALRGNARGECPGGKRPGGKRPAQGGKVLESLQTGTEVLLDKLPTD